MPMRGELSMPAMRAQQPMRSAEPAWFQALGISRSPDLTVVIIFAVVGLLAAAMLTLLLPFSDEVASFLALAS